MVVLRTRVWTKAGKANSRQPVGWRLHGPGLVASATVLLWLLAAAASAAPSDEVAPGPGPAPGPPAPEAEPPGPPQKASPRGTLGEAPTTRAVGKPHGPSDGPRGPDTPAPPRPAPPKAPDEAPDRFDVSQPHEICRATGCTSGHTLGDEQAPAGALQSHDGNVAPAAPASDEHMVVVGAGAGAGLLALAVLVGRSAIVAGLLRVWTVFAVRREANELDGHPVRSTVLRHLELHPGATTRELATASGVTYRRVVYHLAMLERGKRLRVRVVGRKRLHFVAHAPRVHEEELRMRALADPATSSGRMLAHMAQAPGPSLSRIARTFGLSVGNTHYHLQRLRDAGLVHAKRQGNRIRHYLTAQGRQWVERMTPLARAQQASGHSAPAGTAADAGVAA